MRQGHGHLHVVDDSLEVITPEGMEAPPAPAQERGRFRVTPRQVGLAVGALVAGAFFAGYAVLAVSGVRALERDRDRASQLTAERVALSNRLLASVVTNDDTAIVAEATRDLLLEHRRRAIALADHARRVRAVDPGVRGLRQALVGALMRDAHDLEHAAQAPVPPADPAIGRGYPYADRLFDQERKQWHMGPGQVPDDPAHLKAADLALVRLATWADEKTGVRLLVSGGAGLRFLDLDSSTVAPVDMDDGVGDVAAGPGLLAVDTGHAVVLMDPADLFSRQSYTDGRVTERVVTPSAAGGVWVQSRDPLGDAVEVDRAGVPSGASAPARGELVADLGPTLLWKELPGPDQSRIPPLLSDYVVTDKASGAVIGHREHIELLAASTAGMVWRVAASELVVTDPSLKTVAVPTRGDLFPRSAAFSPDGALLAVAWGDGRLDIVDLGRGAVLDSVPTAGPSSIRWTPSGQYVFFETGVGLAWHRLGETRVHRLRLRNAGGYLVAAF